MPKPPSSDPGRGRRSSSGRPARPGGSRGGKPDASRRSDGPRSGSGRPTGGRGTGGGAGGRGSGGRSGGRGQGRSERPERESEGPAWQRRAEKRADDDRRGRSAGWGGVARKGAGRLRDEGAGSGASQAFREAAERNDWEPEVWIDEGVVRGEAAQAVGRGRTRRAQPVDEGGLEPDPSVQRAVEPSRLERFESRLKDASKAFRRERYDEARKLLRPLAEAAPTAESVRELLGLTYYRLGRWKQAITELEAFRDLSGSTEQHPVLADCYRALGRHAKVAELWDELKRASPSAPLVAEGRIVYAGSLADQGNLADAIEVLEAAKPPSGRPREHHLRVTYALADLHERAGNVPKARQLFGIVAASDPEMGDVTLRLQALR